MSANFAERCFSQIEGFGEYGFPESHAASFALLVYVSAWIKCHYPDVFCAAILNSQPMGFYAPAQLVRDARQHGVEVLRRRRQFQQLGLHAGTLALASLESSALRSASAFARSKDCRRRKSPLSWQRAATAMAASSGSGRSREFRASRSSGWPRPMLSARSDLIAAQALWIARRFGRLAIPAAKEKSSPAAPHPLPLFAPHFDDALFPEPEIALPAMPLGEQVIEDYRATGLSLKEHPCTFFREDLNRLGVIRNADHRNGELPQNARIMVAGLVLVRQQPGTAKGVIFMTIEDETDIANLIIWPKVFAANRRIVMTGRFLAVSGRLQRAGLVVHVVAEQLHRSLGRARAARRKRSRRPPLLKSRDFH